MAASKTGNLMDMFEFIHHNKLSYCVLCLRTERERAMVPPKFLSVFLDTLSNKESFKTLTVCHICEANAKAAMKFMSRVRFALSVDYLFTKLASYTRSHQKTFASQLNMVLQNKVKDYGEDLDIAKQCQKTFQKVQRSTELSYTNVLVVYSDDTNNMLANNAKFMELGTKENDTFIIDDDDPVIINNDNQPYVTNLVINNMATHILPMNNDLATQKNLIMDTNGAIYTIVPNQMPTLDVNPLLQAPVVPLDATSILPNVEKHNTTNVVIDYSPLLKSQTYPSNIVSQYGKSLVGGNLVLTPSKTVGTNPMLPITPLPSTTKSTPVLPVQKPVLVTTEPILIEDDSVQDDSAQGDPAPASKDDDDILNNILEAKISEMQKKRQNDDVNSGNKKLKPANSDTVKLPAEKSDGASKKDDSTIDWEDKIPMDLISFVEPTGKDNILISNIRSGV